MELKQGYLNLTPLSNISIDFKLSETHLSNQALLSPTKGRDSLTYTISMETISDHQHSPRHQQSRNTYQLPQVEEV